MNTREKAMVAIQGFLESDDKCLRIVGTHQYEKYKLALSAINAFASNKKILFRGNSMQNASDFLGAKRSLKTGERYNLGENYLYVDSINSRTWGNTPHTLDYAVIYPFDSVTKDSGRDEIIRDLMDYKSIGKLFFVSWTDNVDFSWSDKFINREVVFDVEEEDPEYHQRMLDHMNGKRY